MALRTEPKIEDSQGLRHRRLVAALVVLTASLWLAGLAAGTEGWSPAQLWRLVHGSDGALIVGAIRAPRTLGAWLTGALLGLAGATAQGLFRNPLADPYLLGAASGSALGVVLVLVSGTWAGASLGLATLGVLARLGVAGAAFAGAWIAMLATLAVARGARQTTRLLLAGIVVGVLLSAVGDLLTAAAPETLRGRQAFLLGNTGFVGWAGCALLGAGLALALPIATRLARALDALALGDDSVLSLGIDLPRVRIALLGVVALATGLAVAQTGLIAFVGLVSPHLVRRFAGARHGVSLVASAAAGGALLLLADILARSLIAPEEVPVGVLTALIGGGYLLASLRRRFG